MLAFVHIPKTAGTAARRLPVTRVNANPDRPPSAQIDPETIELISTANRLDMELYEFAHQRFEKQLRALGARAPA